jgi:hypothetical protein
MKVLHLTLKKKWFDMVSDPDPNIRKDEEYREIKPYWIKRLTKHCTVTYGGMPLPYGDFVSLDKVHEWNEFDAVCFHWGYSKNHPTTLRECKGIDIGKAKPEWSDNWKGRVFIIKLGEILETKNLG